MKNNTVSEKELFETIPVPRAVATLAVPTVISQIVTMIYNLADTFFVGQIGNPLLNLLGASPNTYGYAQSYLVWVVVIGGVPAMLSLTLGHFLRSEGHAGPASAGMMFGGILNVVLDPVLIFGFHLEVAGAAIATAFSNLASVVFFVIMYLRLGEKTAVSLHPKYFTFRFVRQIFSVGLASALATALGNASNMVIVRLASGYGDIPVAAYGIVKRIDQFPLNVSMGLCQGFMPLVGYNYAAKNYKRMRAVSFFSWKTALIMSVCFVACFSLFAPGIMHLFIREAQAGASEYPSAHTDESDGRAVRHDLDSATGRSDYASRVAGDVYAHFEKIEKR